MAVLDGPNLHISFAYLVMNAIHQLMLFLSVRFINSVRQFTGLHYLQRCQLFPKNFIESMCWSPAEKWQRGSGQIANLALENGQFATGKWPI